MNLFAECCTLSPQDRLRLAGWLVRSTYTRKTSKPPPTTVDAIKRAIRRERMKFPLDSDRSHGGSSP
jgi:hypothetical protein